MRLPVPLPNGWTALLERAYVDGSHSPPYRCLDFLFTGPSGQSLRHTAKLQQTDIVGLNRQGMVNLAWLSMGRYVLSTILDQQTPPDNTPSVTIDAVVNIP